MLGIATRIAIDSTMPTGDGGGEGAQGFRSTWETSNISTGSSAADTITLPLTASGTYDFIITWGDPAGTTEHITSAAQATHTYDAPGQYDITIFGDIVDWSFSNTGDKLKILNISNWGTFTTGVTQHWFSGCTNMECTATDTLTQGSISLYRAFYQCTSMTALNTSDWDMGIVSGMDSAFWGCSSLTTLDTSSWDTSSWVYVRHAFRDCTGLTSLEVGGWDMSNIYEASYFFANCSSLGNIAVSGWTWSFTDPALVNNLSHFFYGCSSFTTLDISNWNMTGVKHMGGMFLGCDQLTVIDTSDWDMSEVTSISAMFQSCTAMIDLQVIGWDVAKVENMNNFANSCTITTAPCGAWQTDSLLSCARPFKLCPNLHTAEVAGWDMTQVEVGYDMFMQCPVLVNIDTSLWSFPLLENATNMFYGCSILTTLDASNWGMGSVTDAPGIFHYCDALEFSSGATPFDVSGWDMSSCEDITSIFSECESLTVLDVSTWGVSTSMLTTAAAFMNCKLVPTIDVSSWTMDNVTSIGNMFNGCEILTSLGATGVSNWFNPASSLDNMTRCFNGCKQLTTIDVSSWDVSGVTSMFQAFWNCHALEFSSGTTDFDVSSWDVALVTNMDHMFAFCQSLNTLNISSWTTTSLEECGWMFYDVRVSSLDVTNWDVSNVTDMEGIFFRTDITSIDVSNWDTSLVVKMRNVFGDCDLLTSITWPASGSLDTSSAERLDKFFVNTTLLPSSVYASMRYWDISNITPATALDNVLLGTTNVLSSNDYNIILVAWEAQSIAGLTAYFGTAVATKSGITARTALINNGWTISDSTPP